MKKREDMVPPYLPTVHALLVVQGFTLYTDGNINTPIMLFTPGCRVGFRTPERHGFFKNP